ncbi:MULTISPECIES: YHYH protein [Flavobacteriaceae]|uniref:YHYH protein n=1 Tax=Flavobacteriaceae TaxID=49546 RepID=UPI0014921F0B|nr:MULTISPECIES: YHYH protein [Allomuricauda]MDC6365073.1 YHYH protein [Muricauda sp. AC10]
MNLLKFPFLLFVLFALSCSSEDSTDPGDEDDSQSLDCSDVTNVFSIDLDPTGCTIDIQTQLGTTSLYSETISGDVRTVFINGVASHLVGQFPNGGNPNTISEASETLTMTTNPELATNVTIGQGYTFGVLFSGVAVDPYTAEFFVGSTGTMNMEWNITALQTTTALGLDCNNAHVQPTGRYHYHGTPSNYLDGLSANGTEMVKIGYAGDGFPIYYKYGYADDNTTIITMESGYQLKSEARGGDGITAPDGCPDGYYFQDYEYVEGISELDACNGRFGKTLDSDNEYYYVITDNFPSSPLCFSGTPDQSFRIGG